MKKIIDEHGRVFGKFSVIDLAVILIVLVIAVALYVRFNVLSATKKSADTGTVTYTVTITGVRDYTVNALRKGDTLFDKNNGGNAIGTISDITVTASKKLAETGDGKIVLGNYIGYNDVRLTVTAQGTVKDGRTFVGRTYELNANSIRALNTKFCGFEATITGIG